MKENEIIKLWRELNIDHVNFNFSCGGDSMNDTDIEIIDKDGNSVENDVISDHIDDQVYKHVEFYVNSDGHYMGESGTVIVTLNEDDEDNPFIDYSKSSQSEWSETFTETTTITLTDKEAKFITDHVLNINGGEDGNTTNFKHDFILTDEETELVEELETKLNEFANDFEPKNMEGDGDGWFSFTTNEDGEDLKLVGNELTLTVNKQSYIYKEEF